MTFSDGIKLHHFPLNMTESQQSVWSKDSLQSVFESRPSPLPGDDLADESSDEIAFLKELLHEKDIVIHKLHREINQNPDPMPCIVPYSPHCNPSSIKRDEIYLISPLTHFIGWYFYGIFLSIIQWIKSCFPFSIEISFSIKITLPFFKMNGTSNLSVPICWFPVRIIESPWTFMATTSFFRSALSIALSRCDRRC